MKTTILTILIAACALTAQARTCGSDGGCRGGRYYCIESDIDPSVLRTSAAPRKNYSDGVVRVDLPGVSKAALKDALIAECQAKGSDLESESASMLTFVKESKNPLANMWVASRYDDRVFYRARLTLITIPGGVQVTAKEEIVSNYKSAFEQSMPYRKNSELSNLEALIRRAGDRAK
jgi:hypothetical protein